ASGRSSTRPSGCSMVSEGVNRFSPVRSDAVWLDLPQRRKGAKNEGSLQVHCILLAPSRLCGSTCFNCTSTSSVLGNEIKLGYIATQVPRFKNCPSPALPLNSPWSTTTLPRDSTVSTTPLIFLPSYAL